MQTLDLSPLSKVTIGTNYLDVPPNLNDEELKTVFHTLATVDKASPFVLGDALCAIEARHGEKYASALQATNYSASHLKNMRLTCARIPKEKRTSLSYKHHLTALALCKKGNEAKAIEYLLLAERENLSTAKMQTLIRAELAPRDKITLNIPDKEYFNALSYCDSIRLYLEKKPSVEGVKKAALVGELELLLTLAQSL